MASEDENWIREASAFEKLFDSGHKRRTFLLVYQLSLSSILPLQEAHVREALTHLYRKFPCLRVCLGERNGQTWHRYMAKEVLDFQIVKDVEHEEMRDLLQEYQYNSKEGPLWCARLLFDTKKDPLALDEDLPYTSHLFLGIHHSIIDGFSLIKICSGFVKILNDVISSIPVNDNDQIGYFASYSDIEKSVASKMSAIQQDPSLMQELKSRSEEKGVGCPLLSKVEPPPYGEGKTNVLIRVLNQDTTRKFIDKCKENRVSINSGFTALTNAAIVSLLVEKQYIEESYKICNGHNINLRRYDTTDSSDALGCYILPPIHLWANVPKNIDTNFWDLAQNLHQDFHNCLETKQVFLVEAYTQLTSSNDNYEDSFLCSDQKQLDCVFSNLGDVSQYFENNGSHVKPYFLGRHISCDKSDYTAIIYFFHTFRGRFTLNMMYDDKYVANSLALRMCNQILNLMEKVIDGRVY